MAKKTKKPKLTATVSRGDRSYPVPRLNPNLDLDSAMAAAAPEFLSHLNAVFGADSVKAALGADGIEDLLQEVRREMGLDTAKIPVRPNEPGSTCPTTTRSDKE